MKRLILIFNLCCFCIVNALAATYALNQASDQVEEGSTLQAMFKQWTAGDGTGTGTSTDCTYTIGTSTGCVYGQSNVDHLKFADLSKYSKLTATVTNGTPRFFFNVSYDSENNTNVYNLTIGADNTEYLTKEGNTYTVDLVKIEEKYGYAHLHAIKASAYNTEVTITNLELQLQAAGPIDISFSEAGSKKYDSRYFQVSGEGVSINYETGEVTATQAGGTIYVLLNNANLSAAQNIKLDVTTTDPYSDICGTSQIFNAGASINTWYGSRYNMQNLDKTASINNVEQDYIWNSKMGSVTKIQWNISSAGTMKINELIITSGATSSSTEPGETIVSTQRRPVDNKHPMWLVHVDVWNNADPQKIIDLIPDDIKPYVVMNLSLSCSYDDDLEMFKKPQNAVQTYRSWASVCCRNNMFFTCQPASGGRGHMPDDDTHLQETLTTMESFFTDYPNFLGWNYAEQFWGFDENSKSSSKAVDRIRLFSKLVPMHKKYGGFLTISFCGNIWSHPVNPIGMMKRNADFLNACKQYPEAILWLYKYTTSANWYNNESVTMGPFISGLAQNYGVRYDNCGWNGAIEEFTKEGKEFNGDGLPTSYPGAVGIAPILEQMALNGACVWDGPELIWTECFQNKNNSTVDGYSRRNWGTYPNFDNIWVDMFRKVIDGTIHIASRDEVLARTKVVMKNDVSAANDATSLKIHAYAAPIDLYHDLYWQNDPFNARTSSEGGIGTIAGYGNNNYLYYKSTGRYATIPIVIDLFDDKAKNAGIRVINRSDYNNNTNNVKSNKVSIFNELYPDQVISEGDLFVGRHKNALVCYYPFSDRKKNDDGTYKTTSYAKIPLKYNTCTSMDLTFGVFSSAHTKEYSDHIDFYLNNYRADISSSDATKTDVIKINGASSKPSYTVVDNRCKATVTESWSGNVYTVTVQHCGPLDLRINCAGNNSRSALAMVDDDALDASSIASPNPEDLKMQPLVIEGEDFDYKNTSSCVTDAYNSNYRNVLGHAAMGFSDMGTNTAASLRNNTAINNSGEYKIDIKYMSLEASTITVQVNGQSYNLSVEKSADAITDANAWKTATITTVNMNKGNNIVTIDNTGGKRLMVDNVTFTPLNLVDDRPDCESLLLCDFIADAGSTYNTKNYCLETADGDGGWTFSTPKDASTYNYLVLTSAQNRKECNASVRIHLTFNNVEIKGETTKGNENFTEKGNDLWLDTWNHNNIVVVNLNKLRNANYDTTKLNSVKFHICGNDVFYPNNAYLTNTLPNYNDGDYSRAVSTGNKYGTVSLPFAAACSGAFVYEITGQNNDELYIKRIDGLMEAGKAYIFCSAENYSKNTDPHKVYFYKASSVEVTEPIINNGLIGTFTAIKAPLNSYVIYNNDFYYVDSEVNVGANRAYINREEVPHLSTLDAKAVKLNFIGGTETSIETVTSSEAEIKEIYTLSGTKVQTLQQGINIVKMSDGSTKKYIIK